VVSTKKWLIVVHVENRGVYSMEMECFDKNTSSEVASIIQSYSEYCTRPTSTDAFPHCLIVDHHAHTIDYI
jgi:hypothetical protein